MDEETHYFVPSSNKKICKECEKTYSECMKWVDLFVIEGPKARSFYGKSEKSNYVTDMFTFELVTTMKGLEKNLEIVEIRDTKSCSYLLNTKGQIISWGLNTEDPNDPKIYKPPAIMSSMSTIFIVAIACGDYHVLALEFSMYLWSWGDNSYGQLGKSDQEPSRISLNNIIKISTLSNSSFAVNSLGIVYAWGKNTDMVLGIEGNEIIEIPTELEINPWNKEINQNNKKYFKTEEFRNVEFDGVSRANLKSKQLENEDLQNRIDSMLKKVDFLEDEKISKGYNKLSALWEKNSELKEILKVKDRIIEKNKNIKKNEEDFYDRIAELNRKKELIEVKLNVYEDEIVIEWDSIRELENEILDYQMTLESLQNEDPDSYKKNLSHNLLKLKDLKDTKKNKQAKIMFSELEKENLCKELAEIERTLKEMESNLKAEIANFDENEVLYQQMVSIKKKQIAEDHIQQTSSSTHKEIIEIISINEAISKTSISHLTRIIGEYSYPEEMIEISYSLLEKLENYTQTKFKISGFSYVGKALIIWSLVLENIKLLQELNRLRSTISSKMLKNTRKSLNEWNPDNIRLMQKQVNQILSDAGIEDTIPFNDLSEKIAAKKKKKMIKTYENKKKQEKSSWRSCF